MPELIERANEAGHDLTVEGLAEIVERDEKRRYRLSSDGLRIRANQGHSIPVELGLQPVEPPELLFHGTATRNLGWILREGLVRGNRHHVHLSPDQVAARRVGKRHGQPVVLIVSAGVMHRDGFEFFLSENGVWLTERVPPRYLEIAN